MRRRHLIAAAAIVAVAIAIFLWRRGGGDGAATGGSDAGSASGSDPWASGSAAIAKPIHAVTADDDPTIQSTGAPAVVEGVVKDATTHQPIAGADVAFWSKKGELTTASGADGRYRLDVTVGAWSARAALGDSALSHAQVVRIDAPHVVVDLELEQLAHVHGVVRDAASHAPVAGAEVSIESPDKSVREAMEATVGRAVLTGGDGSYRLATLPGEVRLKATAPGGKLGHKALAAIAPGGDATADLELRGTVAVDGKVVDGSGKGVAGASVMVYVAVRDIDLDTNRTITTGADGGFAADGLNPGALTLVARTDDGGATDARTIDLAAGDQHGVVLTMSAPTTLHGHVKYADGRPANDATVKIRRMGLAGVFAQTSSGTDGAFTARVPGSGHLEISASNEYGTARLIDAPADQSAELVIHVPGGIKGLVHAKAGPIQDYTVAIDHFQPTGNANDLGAPPPQRYTPADGKFEWPKLEPGTYDLTVRGAGAGTAHVRGVVVPDGAWASIDVVLDGAALAIAGKVHAGATPIANARVDASCTGANAITGADGAFTIADAPPGDCGISVSADGYATAQRTVKAGAPIDVELVASADVKQTDLTGVGVLLQPYKGSARVVGLVGAPARGALELGDVIVGVDGDDAGGLGFAALVARIRGEVGTKVRLTVVRGGSKVELELVRARIAYSIADPGVA